MAGEHRSQRDESQHSTHHDSAAVQHGDGAHTAHHAAHGYDQHAGHSVQMFRQKFWGTLLLSLPTVIWGR